MKETPILFSTPMVKATLEGRKTQTRRIIKPQPENAKLATYKDNLVWHPNKNATHLFDPNVSSSIENAFNPRCYCPYGWIGDRLWVRETWRHALSETHECFAYKADNMYKCGKKAPDDFTPTWRPSIFMPKKACRLWLEITNVRVERLQDISEEDAIAEGAMFTDFGKNRYGEQNPSWHFSPVKSSDECLGTARYAFGNLWESINGLGSWDINPWVWVLEIKTIGGNLI